ncbi:hypothetical protein BKA59DRAFT_553715 [Fusarium tricinctum]|uniref:CFEM domain-containing protein n=1 Tax=Fusarium tricinctum TaxID=61284 RepID=A0A8K0S2H4_9HYPO|nr:hypothetical protein BKA59DRAFT_553715 [Fusarium tricinctum]
MVRLYNSILLLSLLGTGLAVAAPRFDQEAELRKSECDNGCFFDSFPGGSCTDDAACMCTQQKYREAYFCCMAEKCDSDVMLESIQRQHTECSARNLDFSFDAEKVCGIKLTTTTASASSASVTAKTTSIKHESLTTTASASITSTSETTTVPESVDSTKSVESIESTESTAQTSYTVTAIPVTDSAAKSRAAMYSGLALIVVSGLLLI